MQFFDGAYSISKNTLLQFVGIFFAILAVAIMIPPAQAEAAPNQLDGTVYWDQNNNGVRDGGEPGLEGVLVRFGFNVASTTTDANGNYTLDGVSGSSTLEVHSGWFRTQCNNTTCAAGPGADNDFAVDNQLIRLTGTDADAGGTFDVGLVPDPGSDYPITVFDQTRPVDIAARFSYDNGCTQGTFAERLCNPGDSFIMRANFLNQGTGPISNPVFAMQLPVGHTPGAWYADGGTAQPGANTVTEVKPFDSSLGYGLYRLNGTIPAASSSSMYVEVTVEANAIGSPTPYPTSSPRDKQAILQVLQIDQTGDPDSNFCLGSGQDYVFGTCNLNPLGQHNKLLATDHTDGSDWNITGTPEPEVDSMSVSISDPAGDVCGGNNAQAELTITNTSTGDTPLRNVELAVTVPSGMEFNLADNPGWFIGGDGRPHTFVNMALLPNGSQTVPVTLTVKDGITSADNGTPALQITSEIVAYDTADFDVNSNFIPGSLSGDLTTQSNVTVSGTCPDSDNGGSSSDGTASSNSSGDGKLADTGTNPFLFVAMSIGSFLLGSVLLWRKHRADIV